MHKALQDKSLGELDSSMKSVIQNLMPDIVPNSNAPSSDPSINESSIGVEVEDPNYEGPNVAEAFTVLSRYFQSLSNHFQVIIIELVLVP